MVGSGPILNLFEVLYFRPDNFFCCIWDPGPECATEDSNIGSWEVVGCLVEQDQAPIQGRFLLELVGFLQSRRKGFVIEFMISKDQKDKLEPICLLL
jgi:hypothetical protein